MKGKIIALILGIIAGIIKTIFLILYLLKAKCPKCKQKKQLKEIIAVSRDREISGRHCQLCQKKKNGKKTVIDIS